MRLTDLKKDAPPMKSMSLRVDPEVQVGLRKIGKRTGIKYTTVARQIIEFELAELERELTCGDEG